MKMSGAWNGRVDGSELGKLCEREEEERESDRVNGGWSREKGRRRERVSDRRK